MLNLTSIVLGLLAWGLGIAAICRKGCPWCAFASFTLCGGALVGQFYEITRLAAKGDWAAVGDTACAIAGASTILLAVTAALNLAALMRGRKKS